MKTAEFTNSIDPDEVAHYEPPHQNLHCLSSSLAVLNMIQLDKIIIKIFTDVNCVVCFLAHNELTVSSKFRSYIILKRLIGKLSAPEKKG